MLTKTRIFWSVDYGNSFRPSVKEVTRNSPNSYVSTAGGVQEMELNTETKHCLAKHEKYILMAWCNTAVTQFFKILQERQKTDFLKTERRTNCPFPSYYFITYYVGQGQ